MEPIPAAACLPIKTLLVGMGNPCLSDDAVGIRLVRDFNRRLGTVGNLEVIEECSTGGVNLLDLLAGFERLIVADSIRTSGGIPGRWYRFRYRFRSRGILFGCFVREKRRGITNIECRISKCGSGGGTSKSVFVIRYSAVRKEAGRLNAQVSIPTARDLPGRERHYSGKKPGCESP